MLDWQQVAATIVIAEAGRVLGKVANAPCYFIGQAKPTGQAALLQRDNKRCLFRAEHVGPMSRAPPVAGAWRCRP
jgi:hypothetical protein